MHKHVARAQLEALQQTLSSARDSLMAEKQGLVTDIDTLTQEKDAILAEKEAWSREKARLENMIEDIKARNDEEVIVIAYYFMCLRVHVYDMYIYTRTCVLRRMR
jgi:hypothetical protein